MRINSILLSIFMCCFPIIALGSEELTIDAGRGNTSVRVPDGHSASDRLPVVVLLHGLGANAEIQDQGGSLPLFPILKATGMNFSSLVDEKKFILVLPNGHFQRPPKMPRHRFWNATDACCDFEKKGVDDASYVMSVIDTVRANENIGGSSDDVYIIGHSNGGFLAHRIGCQFSRKIKAIVSVSGTTFLNNHDCLELADNDIKPLHILQIHGDKDEVVNFNGGDDFFHYRAPKGYPGAEASVQSWGNIMKDIGACNGKHRGYETNYNLALVAPIGETLVQKFDCSNQDSSIELWKLRDVGHLPNFSASFGSTILNYLFAL